MSKNPINTDIPIRVTARDWRKIPASVKTCFDGIPRIRTLRSRQVVYAPVEIVGARVFG